MRGASIIHSDKGKEVLRIAIFGPQPKRRAGIKTGLDIKRAFSPVKTSVILGRRSRATREHQSQNHHYTRNARSHRSIVLGIRI